MSSNNGNKRQLRSDTKRQLKLKLMSRKDSLDRFGDDLIELLLSFMPIGNKFRFECVSKQWQRLVFNKQKDLTIDLQFKSLFKSQRSVDVKAFKMIFKKLSNITSIKVKSDVEMNRELLAIIVKNCIHLNAIKMDFSFIRNAKKNTTVLELMPKLTSFGDTGYNHLIITQNRHLLQNLKDVSLFCSSKNIDELDQLIDNNAKSLQSIKIFQKSVTHLMKSVVNLSNLKSISLKCLSEIDYTFLDSLNELSNNCQQLKRISMSLRPKYNGLQLAIIKSMNDFKHLTRLSLWLYYLHVNIEFTLSSEPLNQCKNLTHLQINSLNLKITDKFFDSIAIHLPKLQSICLNNVDITEGSLKALSKLANIQVIHLGTDNEINKTVFDELVPTMRKINTIALKRWQTNSDLIYVKNGELLATPEEDINDD